MQDKPARLWRRAFSLVLWYLIPSVIALAAIAYTYGALVWHVNPPAVAVEGTSMLPTLHTGELVFLAPANPATLKKGEIIAVRVPTQSRTQYGLPANVVHRIVRIEHTSSGLVFITKGDNNPGNDVFTTSPGNIVGRLRYVVPGVGFAFLFIQSRAGEITLGALALVGLLYYFFGLLEERRATTREALGALEAALIETQKFEEKMAQLRPPLVEPAQITRMEATPPVIVPIVQTRPSEVLDETHGDAISTSHSVESATPVMGSVQDKRDKKSKSKKGKSDKRSKK